MMFAGDREVPGVASGHDAVDRVHHRGVGRDLPAAGPHDQRAGGGDGQDRLQRRGHGHERGDGTRRDPQVLPQRHLKPVAHGQDIWRPHILFCLLCHVYGMKKTNQTTCLWNVNLKVGHPVWS